MWDGWDALAPFRDDHNSQLELELELELEVCHSPPPTQPRQCRKCDDSATGHREGEDGSQ